LIVVIIPIYLEDYEGRAFGLPFSLKKLPIQQRALESVFLLVVGCNAGEGKK
jgi:hypothetical protein